MRKKMEEKEPSRQLTPEAANILIHHLYLLIDEIQFRYCPYEPVTDADESLDVPDDGSSL